MDEWSGVGNSHSGEAMRVKAVNRKPMNRPEGTLAPQGGEEVSELLESPTTYEART
ncbi:hypothetical protein GCM10007981_14430 [Thermocladium modestius]|uniref:Uncharacterized protein n=1 Tax=Thermocladium modestius TaxID=62609 RepID=A0A830GZQ8_9CREN|nr:hypothetical protein GCM10007981_14430 [Thermocladium modestius]